MKQTTFLRVLPLLAFGAIPVAADVVDTYSNQSAIQWSTGNDPGSASSKTVSFGPGANSGVSFDITFATNQGNLVTRPYVSKNFLSDSTGINGGAWFEGNLTITVNNFSGAALDDIRFRLVDFSGRSLVTNAINFTSTATPTTAEISLGTGLTDNPFTDVALDSNVANMAGGTYTATLPWKVYDPESSGLFEDFSFEVTVADPDTTPPTITSADIADDVFGGPIIDDHGPMTYTLSFSEAMSPGTITLADFENAGTASASIDAVNPTLDPAVFEVKLTPNSAGTLLLQIKQGALLEDIAGNDLDTGSAITDSTTITVNLPPPIITSLSPANGATGVAQIGSDLVIVFGETVVKGSGNIVLRTAGMTVQTIDVNSSSVVLSTTSVANDTVTIDINDLEEVTNYAIRIGAGAILDNFAVPYPGISDDTTWNFTSGGDPLSAALAQLTDHIDGTLTLTGSEIAARKQTIDTEKTRLDDSTALIIAALNLVSTYDTVVGPLWLNGSPVQGFDRTTVSDENIAWVVFNVMQSIMDEVYNADALADSAKRALLDGFKFGSSADFPGAISPPASPTTHTATISASFPDTFGRDTQQWTLPARKPTGCYLAPGSIVTVEVPAALVGKGIKVRVGAHSWDNEAANLKPVPRLSRATVLYDLDATSIAIASPYGGGIYLEIPKGLVLGEVDVDITGAVRSPYFSSKSFHTTTDAEWINTERNHPAPWADFQTEKFMMQVPSSWIRQLSVPTARMADWDAAMDAMNDLMGFPRDRGKETMYLQVDMILRSTVNAPGYPAVNVTYNPDTSYNGNVNHYLVQGPRLGVAWEFHEQGHAYSIPKFEGERESTANLLDVAVSNRMFGFNLDYSFAASLNFQDNPHRTLNNTAVAWMTSFNFSPREAEMQEHEKQYQLKGHAKYVDIVRLFGWESLERYWRSYNLDEENGDPLPATDDAKIIRLCEQVGEDLRPLLHFWGIFPDDPVAMQAAIDAAGLTPSREVYQRLIQYKALIPTNNANFQTFAFNWWGKQPSSSGFTTERDHARQWNTTSFFQAGDQQRSQATNPGEIYNENSAGDLHARMQEIIDLYFLNLDLTSPTPNPTTFDIPPAALGRNSVTMTATTASDPSDVEYYFECTAGGGNDSGWQDDKIYTDTDLTSAIQYTYRVRARDKSLNQNPTGWSATASATTDVPDTPPSLHATIPADNTTGVSFATDLTATFSEDIVIGSGNIIIQKTGGGTLATIPVTDGTQVSVAGATLTIFPSANFATATGYFVEISAGAIVDKDGNDFAGISGSSVWNFTTDNNEGILAGELGILDPTSANGGINPATGVPWAEGDRYHLAFVTSGTRNATSGDIADYHAFVQAAAAAAGMGGATWYCVGQSYNDPSRDVNAPPMTTSTSIILADGVTKLADDGPDLANGPDHPFSITELGTSYLGFVATGSGRKFGTPDEPKIEVGNSAANWWQAFNSPKTNQWHFYAISEELKIVRETSGSFAGWIGGYNVGELIGFADDPDGDGLVNGIEAFFGSDPSVQSSGLTQLSKSGNVFTVQHPQALELPSDISGSYMWSTNLEDWYSVADSGIGTIVSIVATPNDPQEGITTARATVTGNVVNELFLRVAVNQE